MVSRRKLKNSMYKPSIFFGCPSSHVPREPQSSSCGFSTSTLVGIPPHRPHPVPFRIQTHFFRAVPVLGAGHSGLAIPRFTAFAQCHCSSVWTCLYLSDLGRRVPAGSAHLETAFSCPMLISPVRLFLSPCQHRLPLAVAWTQAAASHPLSCMLCEAGVSWQQHTVVMYL